MLTDARVVLARARAVTIRVRVVPTRPICAAHTTPGSGSFIQNRNYFPIVPEFERSEIKHH